MNNLRLPTTFQFVVFGSLAAALILTLGFVWPKWQELSLVNSRIAQKQEVIDIEKEYFADLEEAETMLEEFGGEVAKIKAAFPDDPSLPSLFNFVQRASSQTGLVLKGISPFTITQPENSVLKEIKVSFELAGTYPSLKGFLSALENSSRLVEVENISFVYPEKEGPFTFNIRIKVFSH